MRSIFGVLVGMASAANGADAAGKSEYCEVPIISIEKAFNFGVETIILAKDLGCYTIGKAVNGALSFLPQENSKQVFKMYSDTWTSIEQFQKQYGIPTCSDVKSRVKNVWTIAVGGLSVLNAKINQLASPVQDGITAFLNAFGKAVPGSATLPTGLLDRVFVFFILYYIFSKILSFVTFFACIPCKICCGGRGKGADTKRAGRYSNSKKTK